MKIDTATMVRLLRGELDDDKREHVRAAIETDPGLAVEFRRLEGMQDLLRSSAADSFGPYFSDRVLERLRRTVAVGRTPFYDALSWAFLRLATASLLLVIGLGAYNAVDSRDSDLADNTVEAVFGLPSADLDNLFYLQGI